MTRGQGKEGRGQEAFGKAVCSDASAAGLDHPGGLGARPSLIGGVECNISNGQQISWCSGKISRIKAKIVFGENGSP